LLVVGVPLALARGLGATSVSAAYDVRGINLTDADTAVVTFGYPQGGVGVPVLRYFDSEKDTFLPVRGSTLAPPTPRTDLTNRLITVVLDRTSRPTLKSLNGTVFTVSVELPAEPPPTGTVLTVSVALPAEPASFAGIPGSRVIQDAALALLEASVLQGAFSGSGSLSSANGGTSAAAGEPASSLVSGGILATTAAGFQTGGGSDLDELFADARGVLLDLPSVRPLQRAGGGRASLLLSPSQASFPSSVGQPPPSKEKPSAPGPQAESRSPRQAPALEGEEWQVGEGMLGEEADEQTAPRNEDLDQAAGEEVLDYLLSSALLLTVVPVPVRKRRKGRGRYLAEQR
jgi:hypothetical protein